MELTTRDRFLRIFQHREADRIPIYELPWESTIERWHQEGMPTDVSWVDYFGCDHIITIRVDTSPQYPVKVLEETDEYKIETTSFGATLKNFKQTGSTPEFLDFTITNPEKWAKAKKQMTPDHNRINWNNLENNYKTWREKGYWIEASFWFGFDVAHSWAVGTERFLMALVDSPEWCVDMFNHYLDMSIAHFEMIWQAGYKFDAIRWPDDLGYKLNQFMSVEMYRELLKPVQKRAVDWAHNKGIYACLHSCGDVNPFIPEWIEIGIDCLNPLEVKAGMNPIYLKRTYGDKLVFHGGINAVLWDDAEAIIAEMEKTLPVMKENGGYIFSSDHSVPSSVSLQNFRLIIEKAKQIGSY